jgi:hypothetical protein
MDISQALHALDELEGNLAVAYEALSQSFSDDPALVRLFTLLSVEEFAHQNLAQYQLRLVRQNPGVFKDAQIDASRLSQAVLASAQFKARASRYGAEDAVRISLALESDAAETYITSIVAESHPPLSKFLQAMAGDCAAHVGRLKAFAAERSWRQGGARAPEP